MVHMLVTKRQPPLTKLIFGSLRTKVKCLQTNVQLMYEKFICGRSLKWADRDGDTCINLFTYLGFYVAFNTVQVISRWVVGRAEETSIYSSLGFWTVNCQSTASNYQLSHLRPCRELNPGLRGGRRECYQSATVAPPTHV